MNAADHLSASSQFEILSNVFKKKKSLIVAANPSPAPLEIRKLEKKLYE